VLNKFVLLFIRAYQKVVSPYVAPRCRYFPTCSSYALASFERFSFLKALLLSSRRILSCHPLGGYGHDPVPKK